ncbi:uncharacterized protein BDV14DRAFT_202222 [Aspergillus stella-maris]|uniref:uncharacterized protein n=1 Tax=Aspergillus stella-maris TaxID=1810926 RepID=UPI003CCD359E
MASTLACLFPSLTDGYLPTVHEREKTTPVELGKVEPEILIAAWALVIAKYIGTEEAVFYVAQNGRIRSCSISMGKDSRLAEVIATANNTTSTQPTSSSLRSSTVDFQKANTAIIIDDHQSPELDDFLRFHVNSQDGQIIAHLKFDTWSISAAQATNLLQTVAHLVSQLQTIDPETTLRQLNYVSAEHRNQIYGFNRAVPEPWQDTFHAVIERHALERPSAPAIDAWDGKFTYKELVRAARSGAVALQGKGVGPGVVVPLCFERSAAAIVSMLAVSMAGGAFVSVPPSLPAGRIDAMVAIMDAPLAITTERDAELWTTRNIPWMNVNEIMEAAKSPSTVLPQPLATPDTLFYLIFTSGSTGVPKGVMVSHQNWLDGALRNAPTWHFEKHSRVLQRLSHTFDMSLLEICTGLGSGACICVPTTAEVEDDVAAAINKYGVTLTIGTPSLAKSLRPQQVPGLKTMCLGGEAFPRELVVRWAEKIHLHQFYGPSECAINSSTRYITSVDMDPLNIGPPNSAACWVVDAADHDRLVPIGAIGELLVSGPIVGMGYLRNPVKTDQVFLDQAGFLADKGDPMNEKVAGFRFYKTGDLVRWNADGTISFCGRADTEVKLNGQRIELGEVEYHLGLADEVHLSLALLPRLGRCKNQLTAILTLRGVEKNTTGKGALPRYMVPTIWLCLASMPMSASGKMDRVEIRGWVEQISEEEFARATGQGFSAADRLEHTSHTEQVLLQEWSEALQKPTHEIGLNQPFVALGGDSILAVQVISRCRRKGIKTSIRDLLTCEGVAEVASFAKSAPEADGAVVPKFSLNTDGLWKQLREGYNLFSIGVETVDDIADVYPCTRMQETIFLGQIRRPGSYHMRFFYEILPQGPQTQRPTVPELTAAWQRLVARHPALRTVYVDDLVSTEDETTAAVYHSIVRKQVSVDVQAQAIGELSPADALDRFKHSPVYAFVPRKPQHRIGTLVTEDSRVRYMMLEISHVIMDGSSQAVFISELLRSLSGRPLLPASVPSYKDFVAHQRASFTTASAEYWADYLAGCPPCLFSSSAEHQPSPSSAIDLSRTRYDQYFPRAESLIARCNENHVTLACAMRAAWALVLRAYTASKSEVCFGYVISQRNAPVADIDRLFGVCIATQPCRMALPPSTTLVQLARTAQADYLSMVPHQHYPLSETLRRRGGQPLFNTVLSMEWVPSADKADVDYLLDELRDQDDPAEYDIGLSVDVRDGKIKIGFLHWPWITDWEVQQMATAMERALDLFVDRPNDPIEQLSLLQTTDVARALPDTHHVGELETCDESILAAIAKNAILRPNESAIDSWDGNLTYGELHEKAVRIASALKGNGVKPGDCVLFCMDRSSLTIAILLGILHSGAAFVAASPESPAARLQSIINHCRPAVIVADKGYVGLFADFATPVLDAALLDGEATVDTSYPPSSDLAYIVYTSGSTGEPKGIAIDHGALATSVIVGQGRRFQYKPDMRVLHFISLTFDISVMEIFTTLAFGATLCIPSEQDRMSDPIGAMRRLEINVAIVTPSICRVFKPEDVPSLRILGLGGEPMTHHDLQRFSGAVQLYNGFGPAEATVLVTAAGPMKPSDEPNNIGTAVDGTRLWVTEVDAPQRLAPLGCVGELLIESRQLAKGYLHDPVKTAAAFLENPQWLGDGTRVYRTGDLVRYAPDGTLRYLGRRDTQVKLRGHRIELGQIEHQLLEFWPRAHVAVECIVPAGGDPEQAMLAAFISGVPLEEAVNATTEKGQAVPMSVPAALIDHLSGTLSPYMVPTAFLKLEDMPITINGKLDRKGLRQMATHLTATQLTGPRQDTGNRDVAARPLSDFEGKLQGLWATILGMESEQIRAGDNFFQLGGNSIAAMKLAVAARSLGVTITVPMVFEHSTLEALAAAARGPTTSTGLPSPPGTPEPKQSLQDLLQEIEDGEDDDDDEHDEELKAAAARLRALAERKKQRAKQAAAKKQQEEQDKPFGLIDAAHRQVIMEAAAGQCNVSIEHIQDIYPATPLQEGMISLTSRQQGVYTSVLRFDLRDSIDAAQFQAAWNSVITAHPILRTRIVQSNEGSSGCFQAILEPSAGPVAEIWDTAPDPVALTAPMGLGQQLIRIGIVHGSWILLAMHHAVYDGWSLPVLTAELEAAYRGASLLPHPFRPFIRYLQQSSSQNGPANFWRSYLANYEGESFPALPASTGYTPTQNADLVVPVSLGDAAVASSRPRFTLSTKIRLAWATAVSRFTRTTDVVFGVTGAGRAVPVDGIEMMIGPTLTTTPTRVQLGSAQTIADLLANIQDHAGRSMAHEHMGLQAISRIDASSRAACAFQTLIILESTQGDALASSTMLAGQPKYLSYLGEESYPLTVYCESGAPEELLVRAKYDSNLIQPAQLSRLLSHFSHVLRQLLREPAGRIGDLDPLSVEDWRDLKSWNQSVDSPRNGDLLHEVLESIANDRPHSTAVVAWDGNWTYADLHAQATTLAARLQSLGVDSGVFVPLLFEKSRWVPVAMLAILKAGGAFVPLDPSHPPDRLRSVVDQVQPPVIIAGDSLQEIAKTLTTAPIVMQTQYNGSKPTLSVPKQSARDPCYVVFTSGSTGAPKGTVAHHEGILCAMRALIDRLPIDADTRMLQFSSAAWDGSILEYIVPWLTGGCVCIPSESDRRHALGQAIADLGANWLHLTPSVLRTLPADSISSVRGCLLLGESPLAEDMTTWSTKLQFFQAYGPSEASVMCTLTGQLKDNSDPRIIGKPLGCTGWVVDPDDHDRLAPIGAPGELLIAGPIVNLGYLNNEAQTTAAFISPPAWFSRTGLALPSTSKLYKTGDLVAYEPDGQLRYFGRKDTQVKVNGQRLELQEVETHLRQAWGGSSAIVADLVGDRNDNGGWLAAFIQQSESPDATNASGLGTDSQVQLLLPSSVFETQREAVDSQLQRSLPPFMVPTFYIPVSRIPLSATGKTNRRKLRDLVAAFPVASLQLYRAKGQPDQQVQVPMTSTEKGLQAVWAKVLGLDPAQINANDDFFRLGGDSILAMQATTQCIARSIPVTGADLFQHRTISRLSEVICGAESDSNDTAGSVRTADTSVPPELSWDLTEDQRQKFLASTLPSLGLEADSIEDVYPCSPVQQGILLTQVRDPRYYQNRLLMAVKSAPGQAPVSVQRLQLAWEQLVRRHPVLRTLFVSVFDEGFADQVVLRDYSPAVPIVAEGDEWTAPAKADNIPDHSVVLRPSADGQSVQLEWTFSHAFVDAWSLAILQRDLLLAYQGRLNNGPGPAYRDYIDHLVAQDSTSAQKYWSGYLEGVDQCLFPRLRGPCDEPATVQDDIQSLILNLDCGRELRAFCQRHEVSLTNVFHLAWALVLGLYLASDEVSFGYQIYGRDVPIPAASEVVGPCLNTLVTRIPLQTTKTVLSLLKEHQTDLMSSHAHRFFPLADLYHARQGGSGGSIFNTGISVQDLGRYEAPPGEIVLEQLESQDRAEWDVTVNVGINDNKVDVNLAYWSSILSPQQASTLAETICHTVRAILAHATSTLNELDLVPEKSRRQATERNISLPRAVEEPIHHAILKHAARRPDAQAVCSWDGSFTYRELDTLSARLARSLQNRGVKPGVIVPICTQKSRWAPVAMLGVLRAGGALATFDIGHPAARLQQICQSVDAPFVLLTDVNNETARSLGPVVIDIETEATSTGGTTETTKTPCISAETPAYVIFTSGSTGQPKASVLDHRELSSQASRIILFAGMNEDSRAFQFASYAFDVSVQENILTLCAGGCVCIPSEEERQNDLVGAMQRMQVNFANFTPSVMRILPGAILGQQIRTVILGGEAPSATDGLSWPSSTRILNTYGPSECTIWCVAGELDTHDPRVLGLPLGCSGWVVDRRDHTRLIPVGAVGELLIEGPSISRAGYLNNEAKTAESFVSYPQWLVDLRRSQGRGQERLYRSGDLVQYTNDGRLRYIGRKDLQVKVRGQRLELGEVEHHLLRAFPEAVAVLADVVKSETDSLVAFLVLNPEAAAVESGDLFDLPSTQFKDQIALAERRLRSAVPAFMVPSAWLPLRRIPQTTSNKIDRKQLVAAAGALSKENLTAYTTSQFTVKRGPNSAVESKLQKLVSQVLNRSLESIGLDDDFFHIGGDSVAAMQLVALARREKLNLSVADVFHKPRLSELATVMSAGAVVEAPSCSLLNKVPFEDIFQLVPGLASLNIVDILPTTQFQRDSLRQTCMHFSLNIPGAVDLARLKQAMQQLVAGHEILRTVFVPWQDTVVQVVLDTIDIEIPVIDVADFTPVIEQLLSQDAIVLLLGDVAFKATLLRRSNTDHTLLLRLNHAQYDGLSKAVLFSDLATAYAGQSLDTKSYSPRYVDYLSQRSQNSQPDAALDFWNELLGSTSISELNPGTFGGVSTTPESTILLTRQMPTLPELPAGITIATAMKATWSLLLAEENNSNDLVFGQVVHGRSVPLPSLDRVCGPCVHIVPVRVTLQDSWTALDLLRAVHSQHAQTIPYETVDWEFIRPDTRPGTVVQHQNIVVEPGLELDGIQCQSDTLVHGYVPHDLFIESSPDEQGDGLVVRLIGTTKMVDRDGGELLLERFESIVRRVLGDVKRSIV